MTSPRPCRPVAMIVHSYYEEDQRVRRQAEALVRAGRPVDVFSLRRRSDQPGGVVEGVAVNRIDVRRHQGAGLPVYLAEYVAFLVRAGWAVTAAHRRRRYALLQVHSLPDFLAFAGLPLRVAGIPMLLDLHEAMPEFFRVRFARASNPLVHLLLELQERASIGLANRVLTVNEPLGERLVRLGVPRRKVGVVRNAPSLERFDPSHQPARSFAEDGAVRLVYAGALSPVYELDVVFRAIARLRRERPDILISFDVYGRDYGETQWPRLAAELGLAPEVTFHGRIPIDDMPAALARADIGLAPTRQSRFTDLSLSTKLLEYAAMGKPVIASALPLVVATFGDRVLTYRPGDEADLAAAIVRTVDDAAAREDRVREAAALAAEFGAERETARYLEIVEGLALDGVSSGRPPPADRSRPPGRYDVEDG